MSLDQDPFVLQGNLYAWREWNLQEDKSGGPLHRGSQFRLEPLFNGKDRAWKEPIVEATCTTKPNQPHAVPGVDCTCGIYAYATLQHLLAATLGGALANPVGGLMRIFGNVYFYEYGVRAQYARPELLVVQPEHVESANLDKIVGDLGSLYKCRVIAQPMQTFYDEQIKLPLEARYPCITPPVNLAAVNIPPQEANLDEINWKEVATNVEHRPTYGTGNRDS